MTLTEEMRRAIDAEAAHYPERRGACIEGLKIVQRRRGWVDDADLADLADFLGMTRAELDSVATFYNLVHRRPVGRHVILLCDSVTCWMLGCDALREAIGLSWGATDPGGRFTLLPIACLGACDRAPALMVGEDLHVRVEPAALRVLLENYP